MKAQFIFENYPLGASCDPNAPWNQPEDHSFTDFEMKDDGDIKLVTKAYVGEDDIEILEVCTIDPMILDKFLLKKLGLNYEEIEQIGMEEDFLVQDYDQEREEVFFKTNIGDTQVSMRELYDLADETRKMYVKK